MILFKVTRLVNLDEVETYMVDGVSLDCQHPFQEVPQFVFGRISVDIPLHSLNHFFTKLILARI